jgi:hypothetical protein
VFSPVIIPQASTTWSGLYFFIIIDLYFSTSFQFSQRG